MSGLLTPRQKNVDHDLLELVVVAVRSVLVGADTFVEIEHWAEGNLDRYAPLKRKGGLKAHRLRAASSIAYREELLGLP